MKVVKYRYRYTVISDDYTRVWNDEEKTLVIPDEYTLKQAIGYVVDFQCEVNFNLIDEIRFNNHRRDLQVNIYLDACEGYEKIISLKDFEIVNE